MKKKESTKEPVISKTLSEKVSHGAQIGRELAPPVPSNASGNRLFIWPRHIMGISKSFDIFLQRYRHVASSCLAVF